MSGNFPPFAKKLRYFPTRTFFPSARTYVSQSAVPHRTSHCFHRGALSGRSVFCVWAGLYGILYASWPMREGSAFADCSFGWVYVMDGMLRYRNLTASFDDHAKRIEAVSVVQQWERVPHSIGVVSISVKSAYFSRYFCSCLEHQKNSLRIIHLENSENFGNFLLNLKLTGCGAPIFQKFENDCHRFGCSKYFNCVIKIKISSETVSSQNKQRRNSDTTTTEVFPMGTRKKKLISRWRKKIVQTDFGQLYTDCFAP